MQEEKGGLAMYKNILFDFDGTVFDTVEGITKSVRYAINKYGLDAELEELRCFAGPPLTDMFAEKFGFSKEQAVEAVEFYRERYRPIGLYEGQIFPGVKELLFRLREEGFRLAVASSKPQPMIEELMRREEIYDCFHVVCGSLDDAHNSKQEIVRRALRELGAAEEESVLVGDTKYDVIGAHQCSIACIGVQYGYAAPGELEEHGVDFLVKNTQELLKLLLAK